MVVNRGKSILEFGAQKIDLALAVRREPELGAEEKDLFLRFLAERHGERQDVGHPAAMLGAAGRREGGAAGFAERRFVVD